MKQKKFYKTFKFWITSLLALSASSIITSLALTSCVANDSANKSDIVINDQTQDQEISIDENKGLTLSVEATSNKGEDLSYQWYVNKTINNDKTWEKIKGATNKTYTIPTSDLQSASGETTWQYKAEIYHNNDSTKKVESKPISVKIKPPMGGSIPEKPNEPILPEKPSDPVPPITPPNPETPTPTPPPTTPPQNPETPTPPTTPPTITPPNNNSDNPSIVPSPGHKPSQGIGARLPLDKTGVITTKYQQEKWIGDNSVSIAVEARPNTNGIRNAVNKFKETTDDSNVKSMLDSMVGALASETNYTYKQFGTGWILDYSNNNVGNVVDYYIASNMHVLNSYFEFIFDSTRYNNSGYQETITVGVRIPFNTHTVSSLNLYISQPTYDTASHTNNLKTYSDQLSNQWFRTNIDINNWSENLIPIGAYNPNYNTGFSYSQAFDMELTWQYPNNTNLKETLYFKSNDSNDFLTTQPTNSNDSYQYGIDDFSVFKISLASSEFDKLIEKNSLYGTMFKKMKELFDINTSADINERSSYIKRLNKLLEITANKKTVNKSDVDNLFMFGDSKKITNRNTQISIGGYPLIQELVPTGSTYTRQSYTTFNTNTLTGNNIIDYPEMYYPSRDKMGINQYNYKGKLYKIKWKGQNNFVLKNVNLLAGSSGGLAIDQNYKISCINWGSYLQIEYHDNIKYVLDSSTSTGLYSPTDENSLVWKWVNYVRKNSKQTKLSQLFEQLEKINYFK